MSTITRFGKKTIRGSTEREMVISKLFFFLTKAVDGPEILQDVADAIRNKEIVAICSAKQSSDNKES